ncbi:nuclear inhibitor of protein phosphatase 1-like [Acanthaster planci]|uniref:Nuclear inhibitor of protein phosphatase 1 n=1 Tax=Acanthaster planci TaxID=133434 RepID=A0A8B7YJ56_ACAPL|nr:nuclear inhibitor of protein phosphatase 1-like [Acanthaster planci]
MSGYNVPSWAGKPPSGLHLDVLKEGKMIEKMMIDEKNVYYFGRNSIVCDFVLDHASCSRVHAALMYHKHLNRSFLVDLGSTHGTFLGSIRLEGHKPQQIPLDSTIRFGASTRSYVLREKPQTVTSVIATSTTDSKTEQEEEEIVGGLLGLPEEETELDNLTEFNTAHNKRVTNIGFEEATPKAERPRKRKNSGKVSFSEDDEIINPEDIDPSVGRFRNLVQTSVVPVKKRRSEESASISAANDVVRRLQGLHYGPSLYADLPGAGGEPISPTTPTTPSTPPVGMLGSSTLGLMHAPNLAPDVDMAPPVQEVAPTSAPMLQPHISSMGGDLLPKKKKYAKEAWPGKKPTPSLLL